LAGFSRDLARSPRRENSCYNSSLAVEL